MAPSEKVILYFLSHQRNLCINKDAIKVSTNMIIVFGEPSQVSKCKRRNYCQWVIVSRLFPYMVTIDPNQGNYVYPSLIHISPRLILYTIANLIPKSLTCAENSFPI